MSAATKFFPRGWDAKRLKFLSRLHIRNGIGEAANGDDPDDPRYIRITDIADARSLKQDTFRSLPAKIADEARVENGDILLAAVGATFGKSVLITGLEQGACFAGYLVKWTPSDVVDESYAAYWTESQHYWDQVRAEVIQATIQNFSAAKYRSLKAPVPPLDTQRRIAAFLDEKTAQIDALIAKKRALLDRLAEKRQAIITQAVTKGFDPTAELKDSGIGWLGLIPTHWEVKRLKYVSPRVTVGIVVTPAAYYADEGVLALRGLNVRTMSFDLSDTRNITEDGHELNRKSELREGDLVAVRTGAPGTTAVVSSELAGCNCIDLVIIRKPIDAEPRYLGWFLNSDVAKIQYTLGSEGALQQHFNVETSKKVVLTLPPLTEQREIAARIDSALAVHDRQSSLVETSIARLQEYRASLITAAVTGQIAGLQ